MRRGHLFDPSSVALDSATAALAARHSTAPTASRNWRMDRCISKLKTAGLWSKLEILYMPCAKNAQAGLLNWKANASNLTASGSPSFESDRGYTTSANNYLSTGLAAASYALMGQNNIHLGVVVTKAGPGTGGTLWAVGTANGTALLRINPRNGGKLGVYLSNSTPVESLVDYTIGHSVGSRGSSSAIDLYKDGAFLETIASTSTALTGTSALLLGRGASNYFTGRLGCFHAGVALTALEVSALNQIVMEYLRGCGWRMPTAQAISSPTMTNAANLPDASGGAPGEGFTCTGLTRAPDGTWWMGNDGRTQQDDASPYLPSLVHLSSDFSSVIDEITIASLGVSPLGSIQGVAYDTSDNTLWAVHKGTNDVLHVGLGGSLLGTLGGTKPLDLNGVAYDSLRGQLILARASGGPQITWTNKDTYAATMEIRTATDFVDHVSYDAASDCLIYTTGANGDNGIAQIYDLSKITEYGEPIKKKRMTLIGANAIEGAYILGGSLIIANDGYYHKQTPRKNRVLTYEAGA